MKGRKDLKLIVTSLVRLIHRTLNFRGHHCHANEDEHFFTGEKDEYNMLQARLLPLGLFSSCLLCWYFPPEQRIDTLPHRSWFQEPRNIFAQSNFCLESTRIMSYIWYVFLNLEM